ncbi:acyltransferase [Rubrivivax sp. JA1024]|nr:acyltransferase [Rubrivivax sp. JA1024]
MLAVTVLLSHTWFLWFGLGSPTFVQKIGIGNFGVMGFFVLSGFIIAEAVDVFYPGRPGAFIANRALRLIPAYWAAAVLSIAVHAALSHFGVLKLPDYNTPPPIMFDARNYLVQITAIVPVVNFNRFLPRIEWYYFVRFAWAIFVEFAFYLYVTACMLAWPIFRRVLSLTVYVSLCAAAAIAIHLANEYVRHLHDTFHHVPYFVLGVAFYAVVTRTRTAAGWLFMIVGYILVGLHFARYTQGQVPASEDWQTHLFAAEVLTPWCAMMLIPLLMLVLATRHPSSGVIEVDRKIGDLTYPLYLNHYAVLVAAYSLLPSQSFWTQATAVIASLIVSIIMKRIVEQPLVAIRNRLRGTTLTVQ